jgi:hypothetical protein
MKFGKFQRSKYLSGMRFHFHSFGGCNLVHIIDVVSAVTPEIVLFPLINRKLNAVKLLTIAKYLKTNTTY